MKMNRHIGVARLLGHRSKAEEPPPPEGQTVGIVSHPDVGKNGVSLSEHPACCNNVRKVLTWRVALHAQNKAELDGVDIAVHVFEHRHGGCLQKDTYVGEHKGEAGIDFIGVHHP